MAVSMSRGDPPDLEAKEVGVALSYLPCWFHSQPFCRLFCLYLLLFFFRGGSTWGLGSDLRVWDRS